MPRSPEIPSLWRPLRTPTFRNLLVADVVSDVGVFMQSTGAAWLMVSLNAGPMYVALTLPAGAIGDIVDRLIVFVLNLEEVRDFGLGKGCAD